MASKRETLLQSAEKNIQKGRLDPALRDLLAVLEESGSDLALLNRVGDLYVRLNRVEESIPYFQKIADHWVKDQRWPQATAIYKRINRLDPARLDVYEKLGELYAKQGLAAESRSHYQTLADHYVRQDNVAGAVGVYAKMATVEPGNVETHVRLAELLVQAKQIQEALKEYVTVAGLMKQSGGAGQAALVYEKALRLAPDNLDVLKALVPLLVAEGRGEDARLALRHALESTPRSVPLFLMAAETARSLNDAAEARNFLAKALAVEPENEEAVTTAVRQHMKGRHADQAFTVALPLADAYLRRGEARKAAGLLVPIARSLPENVDALRRTADALLASGDEASALPFRSALAEAFRKEGRSSEAAEILKLLCRLHPDVPEFRSRLSQIEPLLAVPGSARVTAPVEEARLPVEEPPRKVRAAGGPEEGEFELILEEETPAAESAPPPTVVSSREKEVVPFPGEPSFEIELATGDLEARPEPESVAEAIEEAVEEMAEEPVAEFGEPALPVSPPRLETPPSGTPRTVSGFFRLPGRRPDVPGRPASAPEEPEVEEALVEAEIFRKYGLLEKAVEQLRAVGRRFPTSAKVKERLFEILLEQGKKPAARKEAEALREAYLAEGRVERVKGLESLLGESLDWPAVTPAVGGELAELTAGLVQPPLPASTRMRPITAAEIEIPMEVRPSTRPRKVARDVGRSIELPDDLKAFETPTRVMPQVAKPGREARPRVDDLSLESFDLPGASPPAAPVASPSAVAPSATLPPAPAPPAGAPVEDLLVLPTAEAIPELPSPAIFPVEPDQVSGEGPTEDQLGEIDFCLEQGMVVDAAERLHSLESRFPDHPAVRARRERLEGNRGTGDEVRPALEEIFTEDLDSVLDEQLGRALTVEMARSGGPVEPAPRRPDLTRARPPAHAAESGLFSDEQEFFDFAEELQSEMRQEAPSPAVAPEVAGMPEGISLEEIFREFKKGVEQQLSPEDFETHYNLGIAYKEMGLTDEAIGEFQVASKDPTHAVECCSMLGLCFLEKGLPQLAIKWYRKGLEAHNVKDEDRMGLLYDLAGVYGDVGDRDASYRAYLEIFGTNATYRDVGEKLKAFQN